MRNRVRTFCGAVVAALAVLGSPHMVQAENFLQPYAVKSVTPDVALTKKFHTDPRWSGSDGACSVPIDENTTVWFFGDTFIRKDAVRKSKSGKDNAETFAFINNTVGVQNIKTGEMKFYWRDSKGQLSAIMHPKTVTKAPYYWPGDGFVLDEKLFVVNKVIKPSLIKKQGDLGFEWKSDDLSVISNGGSAPTSWTWKSVALPEQAKGVLIGTACILKNDHAYFYTSLQKDARGTNVHPTGLSRISKRDLLALDMGKFEFWNGKKWVADAAQSSILFEDGASEMTVTDLELAPWIVATYMAPLSGDICMRFAKAPEGPWSDPIKVYECPEHRVKVLGRRCSVYSAKAHPEFSKEQEEVVVTYCSNPGEMKHYLARPDLYYPRVLRVKLRDKSANVYFDAQ